MKSKGKQKYPRCIYPGLAAWIRENRIRGKDFAAVMFVTEGNVYFKLSGHRKLTLEDIRAILDFTGLSFEEAFGEHE